MLKLLGIGDVWGTCDCIGVLCSLEKTKLGFQYFEQLDLMYNVLKMFWIQNMLRATVVLNWVSPRTCGQRHMRSRASGAMGKYARDPRAGAMATSAVKKRRVSGG